MSIILEDLFFSYNNNKVLFNYIFQLLQLTMTNKNKLHYVAV